jgi:RHS repeat-associated protein
VSNGYAGLDRFGRPTDLRYTAGLSTRYRGEHGYDLAGNRMYARITQVASGGYSHVNDRSYLYGHDALDRLTVAILGQLNATNDAIIANANVPLHRQLEWTLDTLGNWTGDGVEPGLRRSDDLNHDGDFIDPGDVVAEIEHAINPANQVTQVNDGGGPACLVIYDRAGNLVFDETYFYQYDGLNRLMQVNEAGSLTCSDFDAEGRILSNSPPPGDLIVQYAYDGLGRLIAATRPVVPGSEDVQAEDYYYDGIRRIQEDIVTPAEASPLYAGTRYTYRPTESRQYVYGPGGAGATAGDADELICQIDGAGTRWYYLHDANLNIVTITNSGSTGSPPAVQLQYTYDPYGGVIFADEVPPAGQSLPFSRVGFQGLIFERLDAASIGQNPLGVTFNAGEPISPAGLYYVRNRWYSPTLGRFLSRDPNETALPVITALAVNGQTLDTALGGGGVAGGGFDAMGHYADGMNLYQFAGSNPINHRDPLGLDWGNEDEIDDLIADRTGHALYALATLNEAASWASIGLQTAVDIGGALLGVDLFQSIGSLTSGKGGFWDVMNVAASVVPGGAPTKALLKAGKYLRAARKGIALFKVASKFGIKPYKELRKLTAGKGLRAHHLIEKRFAVLFGQKQDDMLAIALTPAEHQAFTNSWRHVIPYGTPIKELTRQRVVQEAHKIYKDYPEILQALGF